MAAQANTVIGKQIIAFSIAIIILWPLGLDQIFPPLLVVTYFLIRKMMTKDPFLIGYSNYIFIIAPLFSIIVISGYAIIEDIRVITFLRDIMIWATGFIFLAHFYKSSRSLSLSSQEIGNGFLFLYVILLATCLSYIIIPFSFRSLSHFFVPDSISSTMLGQRTLMKSFGEQLYFFGFTDRVRSFFAAPIHLACVIILIFPFIINRFEIFGWKFVIYIVTFFILFFAQARLALVCLAAFPLIKLGLSMAVPKRSSIVYAVVGSGIILLAILTVSLYADQISGFLYELFVERRRGSAEVRGSIYTQTWDWFLDRPWFGYGTQRDVPGLDLPLGSHSAVLGAMFKHGIFAGGLIVAFLLTPAIHLAAALRNAPSARDVDVLGGALAGYLCYLILIMVNEFIVDPYHTVLLMIMIGIFSGTCAKPHRKRASPTRYNASAATRSARSLRSSARIAGAAR